MNINRDKYLNDLINRMHNGMIKVVTGIRRCGKSYLLRTLFKNHLLENGVDEKNIIEMAFDLYYFLLDEVQLLDEFVSVLNGLADKKNCDVFVTGSNA